MRPLRVGEVIEGHRIEGALGAGGYGAVYAAVDLALERPVALKVLHPSGPDAAARFRDEARLLARINDPHVVQVYQVGALDDDEMFLTMERFGDGSLSSLLVKGQPQSHVFAADITRQILEGLAAAHEVGIVHRDIKEANVLVDRARGRVKVCDFGIARARLPMEGQAESTGQMVLGTTHYIAPERFRGVRDDPRSDLYAVGVILYRLLTGARPFEAPGASDALSVAHKQMTEPAPAPRDVPRGLAIFCTRLLARSPDERPASARLALDELARAMAPSARPVAVEVVEPRALPIPEAPPTRRGPHPLLLPLMSVVTLLLIITLFWHMPKLKAAEETPAEAAPVTVELTSPAAAPRVALDAAVGALDAAVGALDAAPTPVAAPVKAMPRRIKRRPKPKARAAREEPSRAPRRGLSRRGDNRTDEAFVTPEGSGQL